METKEEFFQFEKKTQSIFNELYEKKGWSFERIYGVKNKDYDLLIQFEKDKKWWKVEEKYRSKDYGDLLVEIIQDTETLDPGWIHTTKAEILFYGFEDMLQGNQIIYWVDMKKLRDFVNKNKDYFQERISTKGWGKTVNIAIPWETIVSENIGNKVDNKIK